MSNNNFVNRMLRYLGWKSNENWLTSTIRQEEEAYPWIKRLQENPHFQEITVVEEEAPYTSAFKKQYRLKAIMYDGVAFRQMLNQFEERSIVELLAHRITDYKLMQKIFDHKADAERFATRHFDMQYVETE